MRYIWVTVYCIALFQTVHPREIAELVVCNTLVARSKSSTLPNNVQLNEEYLNGWLEIINKFK